MKKEICAEMEAAREHLRHSDMSILIFAHNQIERYQNRLNNGGIYIHQVADAVKRLEEITMGDGPFKDAATMMQKDLLLALEKFGYDRNGEKLPPPPPAPPLTRKEKLKRKRELVKTFSTMLKKQKAELATLEQETA